MTRSKTVREMTNYISNPQTLQILVRSTNRFDSTPALEAFYSSIWRYLPHFYVHSCARKPPLAPAERFCVFNAPLNHVLRFHSHVTSAPPCCRKSTAAPHSLAVRLQSNPGRRRTHWRRRRPLLGGTLGGLSTLHERDFFALPSFFSLHDNRACAWKMRRQSAAAVPACLTPSRDALAG